MNTVECTERDLHQRQKSEIHNILESNKSTEGNKFEDINFYGSKNEYLMPLQRTSQRVSNMDSMLNYDSRNRASLEERNKELEVKLNNLESALKDQNIGAQLQTFEKAQDVNL